MIFGPPPFILSAGPIKVEPVTTFDGRDLDSDGSLTISSLSIGAIKGDRETFISLSAVAGTASNHVTAASLGGDAMTLKHATSAGGNFSGIYQLSTGSGSTLAAATSANLVLTGFAGFSVAGSVFRIRGGTTRPLTFNTPQASTGSGSRSVNIDVTEKGGLITCFTANISGGNAVSWTNANEYADFDFAHALIGTPGRHSSAIAEIASSSTLSVTATFGGASGFTTLVAVSFY